jgi:hypothetical protein
MQRLCTGEIKDTDVVHNFITAKNEMVRHLFEIVITFKHLDGWNIIAGSPKAADS